MFTFGSLFTGIGGLDLGLERAGWKCLWQAENEAFCQDFLAHKWPRVPNYGDVTQINWEYVPRVDLVAGGFPCQPFSVLGAGRGDEDERYLWPEFRRCLRVVRPRYVLVENVPPLKGRPRLFGEILGDLSALGFDAEWDVVSACSVGAPHLRRRLFILAYPRGERRREESGSAPEFKERNGQAQDQCVPGVHALQGRGGTWLREPTVGLMADGLPVRLVRPLNAALGNAVVPPLAEWIARNKLPTKGTDMTDDNDWGEPQSGGDVHDLEKEGALIGTYLGYKEINGDYGVSRLHEFSTEEGKKAVWGKAHLNRLLEGRAGELVKVVLTGNKVNLGGGRTMVEYQLFSKGRQAVDLPQTPLPAPQSASNGGGASQDAPFPSNA